jgi:hypothetical protein
MIGIFMEHFPQCVDLWRKHGKGKCITFGRVNEVDGKRVPQETVMTSKNEQESEMALDYIFCMQTKDVLKVENMRLEHMEVTRYANQ